MSKKDYIYIFLHIPRTAGSTFVKHIEKNFIDEERLRLYIDTLNYVEEDENPVFDYTDYKKIVKNYIENIDKDLSKVKIIYGHIVPYGIHEFFEKIPRYFTFIRNPIKRAVSLYNFWSTSYFNQTPEERKKVPYYKYSFLVNGKPPEFQEWVDAKIREDNYATHSMLMSRFFASLGYMKKDSLSSLKKRLEKFYYVGTTSKFDEDALYLFFKLGVNKFFINQNVSKKYIKHKPDSKMVEFLEKRYKNDIKIFKIAKKIKKRKKDKFYEFDKVVSKMKLKRKLLLPITQLLFDFKYGLKIASHNLKKRSVVYKKFTIKLKEILGIREVFS